jgi:pimeloyl-ACP methyl ester carboxylesterase
MNLAAEVRGAGPPLILLPWFGLDHHVMMAACEPALGGSRWRRVYLDLPGTGASAPVAPASDAVADAAAAAVAAHAGGSPVALAGCSYGGYIAAELARRDPERVIGLLMVGSGVRIRPADRNLSGVLPAEPEPGWLDDVPGQLRGHFGKAVGCQTREVAARLTAAFLSNDPADEAYLGVLRSAGYRLSAEAALPAAGTARTAVTVIAGRRDRIVGYRDHYDFAAARSTTEAADGPRAADYIELADVGHYLPFEQPSRFRALIRDWLGRCEQAARGRAGAG